MEVVQEYFDFFISVSLNKDDHFLPQILDFIILFLFSFICYRGKYRIKRHVILILESSGF